MDADLKKALDDVQTAHAEFKAANDKALAQKAEKGYVDAQLAEQVEKWNAAITAGLEKADKRVDELERRVETDGLHDPAKGAGTPNLADELAHFRNFDNIPSAITVDQYRGYRGIFGRALRKDVAQLSLEERAAMQVGSAPDGGIWVPPNTGGRIVTKVFESSPIRQIASVQTISSDSLGGVRDDDEADCGWVGETGARPETGTPQIGEWRVPVHEMYAEPKVTQKLLDDAAVDVEAWLAGKVADKFARTESAAFVTGDGVGKPRGFLTYPTAATDDDSRPWGTIEHVVTGAAGAFAAADPADPIITLVFALKDAYAMNAVMLMRRSTEAAVRKLKDGQDNYLWQPDFTAKSQRSILGVPVMIAADMPAIAANSLSIAVGDFRTGYQIVDRVGIRVLRDPYTSKPWVKFYTTKRVGGGLINTEAVKVLKFSA